MNKLILGTAFAALTIAPAMAQSPQPSDAHPPGALFLSTPNGWNADGTMKPNPAMPNAGLSHSQVGLPAAVKARRPRR